MDTSRGRFRSTNQSPLRIVGVDDGAFAARRESGTGTALLVAVLLHGHRIVDAKLGRIQVDGTDAAQVLVALLQTLSYDVVMLSGITFGGFNLIDIKKLAKSIGKPVIAVIGERPNSRAVRAALREHFGDWRRRWGIVRNAGALFSCKPLQDEPKLYFEVRGGSSTFARRAIIASSLISRLPEPVRVAGMIARGLSGAPD